MYTCQFFNRDNIQNYRLPHLLSAYRVTTDATYYYAVSQDDMMFYPHDTYCLIAVTLGAMEFKLTGEKNIKLISNQCVVINLKDIISYKSQSEQLEYVYFNYLIAATELPCGKQIDIVIDMAILDCLMHYGSTAAPNQVIDGLFSALCYSLTHVTQQKSPLTSTPSDYIKQKLYFKLTNKEIADHCNISTRALTNLFNKHYHTTPQGYLFNLKIERAMTLLATTATPISEIAYLLSFNSPFHFSNRFKKTSGMSPSAYRKRYAN